MKIAICGIGGVGGLVAGALAQSGHSLFFLARGQKREALRQEGLLLLSDTWGERLVQPLAVEENGAAIGVVDVVFFCTKSYGLEEACAACAPMVGEDTLVIPLLNGIAVAEEVKGYLKKGRVADGCIYCFSALDGPRVVRHTGNMKKLVFGFAGQEAGPKELELVEALRQGGMDAHYDKNVLSMAWEKYCMMCGNSAIFAYFDCPAGPVQADEEKMMVAREVYTELWQIGKAHGIALPDDLVEKDVRALFSLPPQTITSLYRDLKTPGNPTELEAIIGKACRLAQQSGVAAPLLKEVYERYAGR